MGQKDKAKSKTAAARKNSNPRRSVHRQKKQNRIDKAEVLARQVEERMSRAFNFVCDVVHDYVTRLESGRIVHRREELTEHVMVRFSLSWTAANDVVKRVFKLRYDI